MYKSLFLVFLFLAFPSKALPSERTEDDTNFSAWATVITSGHRLSLSLVKEGYEKVIDEALRTGKMPINTGNYDELLPEDIENTLYVDIYPDENTFSSIQVRDNVYQNYRDLFELIKSGAFTSSAFADLDHLTQWKIPAGQRHKVNRGMGEKPLLYPYQGVPIQGRFFQLLSDFFYYKKQDSQNAYVEDEMKKIKTSLVTYNDGQETGWINSLMAYIKAHQIWNS